MWLRYKSLCFPTEEESLAVVLPTKKRRNDILTQKTTVMLYSSSSEPRLHPIRTQNQNHLISVMLDKFITLKCQLLLLSQWQLCIGNSGRVFLVSDSLTAWEVKRQDEKRQTVKVSDREAMACLKREERTMKTASMKNGQRRTLYCYVQRLWRLF